MDETTYRGEKNLLHAILPCRLLLGLVTELAAATRTRCGRDGMETTHNQIQREGYSRKHIREEDELRASAGVLRPPNPLRLQRPHGAEPWTRGSRTYPCRRYHPVVPGIRPITEIPRRPAFDVVPHPASYPRDQRCVPRSTPRVRVGVFELAGTAM